MKTVQLSVNQFKQSLMTNMRTCECSLRLSIEDQSDGENMFRSDFWRKFQRLPSLTSRCRKQ